MQPYMAHVYAVTVLLTSQVWQSSNTLYNTCMLLFTISTKTFYFKTHKKRNFSGTLLS